MSGFTQTWAGECSAWECDDLGHLNMRHYMTKTRQARQMVVMSLGLTDAFTPRAQSSVQVTKFHIKYLGEARPGDPLRIESAVLALGQSDIQLCHMMYHSDGRLACSVVEWADHIYLRNQQAFPWPQRVKAAAEDWTAQMPAPSRPRGLTYEETYPVPSAGDLSEWGVRKVGSGVFQPHEAAMTGHISVQALLGRSTETIGHVREAWPEMHEPGYREDGGSAALLEAFIIKGAPARVGDGYHFHSGIHSANSYTRRLVYNMVNAVTGENIFSMTGIGCLFNLKTRKLVKTSSSSISAMTKGAIKEFSP